jgi:hypothetical protein
VVNEHTGRLWRLQVKTATAQSRSGAYQVIIDERQIQTKPMDGSPDVHFVFALRRLEEGRWRFVVMKREDLKKYIDDRKAGTKYSGKFGSLKMDRGELRRTLSMSFSKKSAIRGQLFCSHESWEDYLENWKEEWPHLEHEKLADADGIELGGH